MKFAGLGKVFSQETAWKGRKRQTERAIGRKNLQSTPKMNEVANLKQAINTQLVACVVVERIRGKISASRRPVNNRGADRVREKGDKTRKVCFGEVTKIALQAWLVVRPRDKWGDVVFVGKRGPLTPSGVYRVLERLASTGGVEGRFNPHSFRHALARRLLRHGADMGIVSQILGHSDMETTHRFYARWTEDELSERHRQYGGVLER